MFTLTVKEAKKEYFQAENKEKLVVYFTINTLDGEKKVKEVEIRSLAFDLDISEEDLKAELKRYIDSYNTEAEMKVKNEANDKAQATADETIANIKGLEL